MKKLLNIKVLKKAVSMQIKESTIKGCYEIVPRVMRDSRGMFIKTYNEDVFNDSHISFYSKEEYHTFSKKNVLRGLHFQTPPFQYKKIVFCVSGIVFDVIVDLRKDSETFGKHEVFKLNGESGNMVYMSEGIAHGFYVLSNEAIMCYKVSALYSKENDSGIRWNSLEIPWPAKTPVVSERDESFLMFNKFVSPF
jgi:dTDP-4-dehydrorhamnose 3,5-epimerase